MKVLTDKDWILDSISDRGFLFKSKRFGDELCVTTTKYVLRHINLVLFCSASHGKEGVEKKISLSKACRRNLNNNIKLSRDMRDLLSHTDSIDVSCVHKLSAL